MFQVQTDLLLADLDMPLGQYALQATSNLIVPNRGNVIVLLEWLMFHLINCLNTDNQFLDMSQVPPVIVVITVPNYIHLLRTQLDGSINININIIIRSHWL